MTLGLFADRLLFMSLFNLLKRGLDILVAASALIVLCPFLVAIGLIIRLSSKGPAVFKQERVGENGKPFIGLWNILTILK